MAAGRKTGGRKKGTPNKVTSDVKAMILTALEKAGGENYLLSQSLSNPTAFLQLVGKVLPIQQQHGNLDEQPFEVVTRIELVDGDGTH